LSTDKSITNNHQFKIETIRIWDLPCRQADL